MVSSVIHSRAQEIGKLIDSFYSEVHKKVYKLIDSGIGHLLNNLLMHSFRK